MTNNITPRPLSPTDKIYPPGECMKPESTSRITKKTPLSFPENTSKIPFSPIVQATLMKDGTFQVRAVFLVARKPNQKEVDLDFDIYQNWYVDLEGERQLQFFIAYDILDDPEQEFDVYETSFKAKPYPYGEKTFANIKTIQTYLWDIDPVTSRGTETTVQTQN
ncbi:hypothetical protein ACFSJW_16880 [Flavobacterium artemisiae]|uniref:Uncharacterized protein n=1 Tax=Flavobacterium artemisiae TaxID=2126556 RepID=A0ABW4H8Q7_9FLAO